MLVSTKGRYALRVMIELAIRSSGEYVRLDEIAAAQRISEKYLESIVSTLAKAGLVEGLRGRGGGYRLTRSPESYSASEILIATEGTLAPVACLDCEENSCERADCCKTLPMWEKLEDIINSYLDSVKLSDLAGGEIIGI